MAEKQDLSDQAMDAAKQLAPWKTSLPWWVVLIEGLVIGGIGLMVILDPQGANVNLALALSVGLVISGLLQIWDIWQERVPEKIDSLVAARAGIGVYAGLVVLVLYFIEGALTRASGYGIFGSAALIYGLLALVQVFRTGGDKRRQALIEFLLFTSAGAVTLYGLYAGGSAIVSAVRIIGWIFLIAGVALLGLSIWRWQKGDEADEMIESVTDSVGSATDSLTSFGRSSGDGANQLPDAGVSAAKDSQSQQ